MKTRVARKAASQPWRRPEEAQAMLAAIVESSEDAIISKDLNGTITSWNTAAERLFGYPHEEAIGQPIACIVPPELQAEEAAILERLRRGERIAHYETVRLAKDGSRIPVSLTVSPVCDGAGSIIGASKILRDITERKQAQEEISRQNEELEAQAEELSQQNEQLQQQSEELSQQNEELQQASEELEQQSEELQAQSEELREVNQELNERESMLQTILACLREASDERQMLSRICQALMQLAGEPAVAAAVVEKADELLLLRVSAGVDKPCQEQWPFAHSFASLVMAKNRTAFVEDLAARPDLIVPKPQGRSFRSLLATPLRVHGQSLGAVEVYSFGPHQWTKHQFRVIEWAAAQCALALETLRLQQGLLRARQEWERTFDSVPDLITVLDTQHRIVRANRAMAQRLNLTPEQLVGRKCFGCVHNTTEPPQFCPHARTLQDGKEHLSEVHEELLGGDFLISTTPLCDEQGRMIGSVHVARDITERKRAEAALRQSEEQFRTLADSMPQLAWWANADGYITWYNRRWYEYTGTTPQQMQGWGWQSVHDPEMLPQVLARWQASIATGEPFDMEFPLRGADGRFRWFLTRVMPLRDPVGKVLRWFGTNTDVSETREARQVLARSKEELERLVAERTAKLRDLVEELEHFSYTITHDMRAPLRAMRALGEVVVKELCVACPQEEPREFLRRIMTAADRMDALIRDALSYNRAVLQELPLEVVDTDALVRGMLNSYPELQPSRAHIQIEGQLPVVRANQAGLTQCFSNLLGNAVKFVKPTQMPEIRVRAESRDGWARIWVEDQGLGIPKSMLPKVFEMFSRGHNGHEGTGIGLALVRKVVGHMGGKVGVESKEGQGSRFWLELKLN